MTDYEIGSTITAIGTGQAGIGETIAQYQWYLDDVLQYSSSNTLSIDSSNLALGTHTIKLEVTNRCGELSAPVSHAFNLVYSCPIPTATFTIN